MTKKIIPICAFLAIVCSYRVSAMQVKTYIVSTTPPITVVQSNERVAIGGISSKGLNMNCSEFNGNKFYAPLNIKGTDDSATIVKALENTFRKSVTVK